MLIGRDGEITELHAALRRSQSGEGQLVLLSGEPGIGKTAIANELATAAQSSGSRVSWGRCREEGGAPAHWPWAQILGDVAQGIGPERVTAALGDGTSYVTAVVPELSERFNMGRVSSSRAAAPNRFAFYDAVSRFLREAALDRPLVLVLDDLHAADASSLDLLQYLAPEIGAARLLVLGTYREHEAQTGEAGPAIGRIARHGQRIRLRGLDGAELEKLVSQAAAQTVSRDLVATIGEVTEGNPLFVREIVRALVASGDLDVGAGRFRLPQTVEQVLTLRLERLSAEARATLSAAAVLGRAFDVVTLKAITGTAVPRLLTDLEEAAAAGVTQLARGMRGEATFAHAVYREFFYGSLSAGRRADLHLEAARALEGQSAEAQLAAIAFHLREAGPLADPGEVVQYAVRAGDQASARLGFAEAARHYEEALEAAAARAGDPVERCDLCLRLGEARFRAGLGEDSRRAYLEAGSAARALGDGPRLLRAALGLAGPWGIGAGLPREDVIDLFEASLTALGEGDEALRALALSRLATEVYYLDSARREALSREAVVLARRAGDARMLAEALVARLLMTSGPLGPRHFKRHLATARQAVRLATKSRDAELRIRAHFRVAHALLRAGDGEALDSEIAAAARLAQRVRQPYYDWWVSSWRAIRALIDARFDEAEQLIEGNYARAQATQSLEEIHVIGTRIHAAQAFHLCRDRGRGLAEMESTIRDFCAQAPLPTLRAFLGLTLCELGRPRDAADQLELLAAGDFASIPEDGSWIVAMALLAELCADLSDRPRAGVLYESLRPYAAQHAAIGIYGYMGSVSYSLGRLAATLQNVRDARSHFEAALLHHRRMGAWGWLTRTLHRYGEMQLAVDPEPARAMLEEALERSRSLGMTTVAAAVERLLESREPAAVPERARRESAREDTPPRRYALQPQGDYWLVSFDGVPFQVKDQKGLRYLHALLGRPGQEVHVLDLLAAVEGPGGGAVSAREASEVGLRPESDQRESAADRQALQAYRSRLRDLRGEISEAEALRDTTRRGALAREAELLEAELRGGAERRRFAAAPALERVRLNVSRAIRAAQRHLGKRSPALERHLARTVRTGRYCSYHPPPDATFAWET